VDESPEDVAMANAGEQPVFITAEGHRRLEERLREYAEQLQRLKTPGPVDEARDRSDEADALESADDVTRLTDMVAVLEDTLRRARPVAAGPDDGIVRHGSTVLVRDEGGAQHRFKLLDGVEVEANPEEISLDSPVGQALLDRAQGDEMTVSLPHGERRFTILSVGPYRPTPL
jgi:transcription elongation GreA/GreB family factor